MRLPKTILIFSFVFINTMGFALSEDALAIIAHYRKKYNNNEELNRSSSFKTTKSKDTSSKELSVKVLEQPLPQSQTLSQQQSKPQNHIQKDYLDNKDHKPKALGESLSAALNRYRMARKTGQLAPTSVTNTQTPASPLPKNKIKKDDDKQKPRLKRYNYNFALQNPEVSESPAQSRQRPAKVKQERVSRQKRATKSDKTSEVAASSNELLERTEQELQKSRKAFKLDEPKNFARGDGKLEHPAIISNSKEREEDAVDAGFKVPKMDSANSDLKDLEKEQVVATQQDDDEFNQFIRRYDFKMPDNYRIIVR